MVLQAHVLSNSNIYARLVRFDEALSRAFAIVSGCLDITPFSDFSFVTSNTSLSVLTAFYCVRPHEMMPLLTGKILINVLAIGRSLPAHYESHIYVGDCHYR